MAKKAALQDLKFRKACQLLGQCIGEMEGVDEMFEPLDQKLYDILTEFKDEYLFKLHKDRFQGKDIDEDDELNDLYYA